jgi:hypothetical protein
MIFGDIFILTLLAVLFKKIVRRKVKFSSNNKIIIVRILIMAFILSNRLWLSVVGFTGAVFF